MLNDQNCAIHGIKPITSDYSLILADQTKQKVNTNFFQIIKSGVGTK